MQLHELPKLVRRKKRRGRGIAGRGAKSGRGMKGQKSRAGFSRKLGFEGGQTPLYMRLPKGRGMKQRFSSISTKPHEVNATTLQQFAAGTIVGPGALHGVGILPSKQMRFKIIGQASLTNKLTVRAHGVTAGARRSIEAAGGKVEIIV